MMMMAKGMGFAGWGKGGGGCPPQPSWVSDGGGQKQKWVEPAGPTQVHWISVPDSSALVAQQGLPTDGPAAIYEKGDGVFSSSAYILGEIVGDIGAEVQLLH